MEYNKVRLYQIIYVRAYPKASTHPPGEPSFLCKPIQLKQLHSASTRNRRI